MLDGPNNVRIAQRRASTRGEILEAAWEIAREVGLTQLTLRELGGRVGMRAPSLYSHFPSKHAIYDAMFEQAWRDCGVAMREVASRAHPTPRARLKDGAGAFFDFCAEDPTRYQLMNQPAVPGFHPSPASYQASVEVMDLLVDALAGFGISRQEDVDLFVALVGGLINAQLANEPGGRRWRNLVDRAIDMYCDELEL